MRVIIFGPIAVSNSMFTLAILAEDICSGDYHAVQEPRKDPEISNTSRLWLQIYLENPRNVLGMGI